jgi:uncharacterized protein (DUF433 family)
VKTSALISRRRQTGPKLIRERQAAAAGSYDHYPLGRYVVIAPGVCGGRPTFKGTRLEVQTILDWLRLGRSIPDIVESYPSISREGIEEAIKLAGEALTEHYAAKAA